LDLDEVSIYKRAAGVTQSALWANSRRTNIRNTFAHTKALSTGTTIIIDDVLTTGATVSEMAKIQRQTRNRLGRRGHLSAAIVG